MTAVVVLSGARLILGVTGSPRTSAVIGHRGWAQLSGSKVEACRNAQAQGIRNRIITMGRRDRDIFCLLQQAFVAQARVRRAVIRAHRDQDQGRFEPKGIGERTIRSSRV